MKCNKCNSKWESTIKQKNCPFCGASLEQEIEKMDSMEKVLKYLVDSFGIDIYNKPGTLIAYVSDYLPNAVDERRLLKLCADIGAFKKLLQLVEKDQHEKEIIQKKVSLELQDHCFLNKIMADKVVYWVSYSLGVSMANSEKNEQPFHLDRFVSEALPERFDMKSEAESLSAKLAKVRAKAEFFEKRVAITRHNILGLNADGTATPLFFADDNTRLSQNLSPVSEWKNIVSLYPVHLSEHIIGLKSDGSIEITKDCNGEVDDDYFSGSVVSKWTNVKEIIKAPFGHIYALTNDGSVLSSIKLPAEYQERYYCGEDRTEKLKDVEKILWTGCRVIARKHDGSLVSTDFIGKEADDRTHWDEISKWKNIDKLFHLNGRMVGIKDDGTLIASDRTADKKYFDFWPDICNWQDIVTFYCSTNRLIALTKSGNILATTAYVSIDQRFRFLDEMASWDNIAKLYFGLGVAAGLRLDGSIVVTNAYGENCDSHWKHIASWKNMIGLVTAYKRLIGIREDGTLIYVGDSESGQRNFFNFKLFD